MQLGSRVQQLYDYVKDKPPDTEVPDLYAEDDFFKFLCDECLRLCRIKSDWVSASMLTTLLFASEQFPFGALVEFNFGYLKASAKAGNKQITTTGQMLGKLWSSSRDLNIALTLLRRLPADMVEQALEELRPQEQKWQDKARRDMEEYARISGES